MQPECFEDQPSGALKAFVASVADLGLGNPFRGEDLVSSEAASRNRVQNRIDHVATLTLWLVRKEQRWGTNITHPSQYLDRSVAFFLFPVFEIAVEKLVLALLCDTPQMPSGPHGHVDDAAGPDIDSAGIELFVDILLGSNVRSRTAQASGHVRLLLPSHSKALSISEIGDLDGSVACEEQVLGLEIAMCDTHFVHVLNTAHELLEEAVSLDDL